MLPFNSVSSVVAVRTLPVFADSKADWIATDPVSRLLLKVFVRRQLT